MVRHAGYGMSARQKKGRRGVPEDPKGPKEDGQEGDNGDDLAPEGALCDEAVGGLVAHDDDLEREEAAEGVGEQQVAPAG